MKTKDNTILITGGATGIGFSLAEALVHAGNKVIICGRREDKLKEAKNKLPQLITRVCDVSSKKGRETLLKWVTDNFKDLNILINNAGILRMINLKEGTTDLFGTGNEIETNLVATIQLSAYFIPLFLKQKEAAIMNVASGLAYVPLAATPIYSATKAAVHSFTMSLRHQLKDTSIKVFEIVPPLVDTALGNSITGAKGGIAPSEVSKATLTALANDEFNIYVGGVKDLVMGSRNDPEQVFQRVNSW